MVNLDYILEHSWGKLCYTENKLLRGLKKKSQQIGDFGECHLPNLVILISLP